MNIQRFALAALTAVTLGLGLPQMASAQTLGESNTWLEGFDDWLDEISDAKKDDFSFSLGAGVGTTPDYPGGDKYQTLALPLFQVKYKDQITFDPLGLRVRVMKTERWRLRLVAGLSESRKAKSSSPVSRLPDVERGVNGGFVLEGRLVGPLAFRLNGRKEFAGGHGGVTVTPSLGVVLGDKAKTYSVIPEVAITWGNNRYMDAFFSVTPAGSAASGLAIYNASAGFREATARVTATYQLDKDWMFVARLQAAKLLSDAKRSSIVRQTGDSFQGLVGVGVMYTF
jgi:outer membrane scaffolding protein for murein synthesis (MipA/OmpV family)